MWARWPLPPVLMVVRIAPLLLQLLLTVDALRTAQPDALNRQWLAEHDAFVNMAIKVEITQHGGASIRGVVADKSIAENEKIIDIPRSLWFILDRFPSLKKKNLAQLGSLCNQDSATLETLKMAVAIALETKKGDTSEFAHFLRVLPTLADYRSFLPQHAEGPILSDFAELPVVGSVKLVQKSDAESEQCLSAWQQFEALRHDPDALSGPIRGLQWPEVRLALSRFRTRCYIVEDNQLAMIPGSDLFNTGEAELINTEWDWQDGHFILRASEPIEKGTEVYDPYCETCDNDYMVNVWGVYLEKNRNELESRGALDCKGEDRLRGATEAALDLQGGPVAAARAAKANGMKAPRCQKATMSSSLSQGPLRCSLARLAWEYCAEDWGYSAAVRPPPSAVAMANLHASANSTSVARANTTAQAATHRLAEAALRPWSLRKLKSTH